MKRTVYSALDFPVEITGIVTIYSADYVHWNTNETSRIVVTIAGIPHYADCYVGYSITQSPGYSVLNIWYKLPPPTPTGMPLLHAIPQVPAGEPQAPPFYGDIGDVDDVDIEDVDLDPDLVGIAAQAPHHPPPVFDLDDVDYDSDDLDSNVDPFAPR